MSTPAPRWDLTNVYPSLESKEFKAAIEGFKTQVTDLEDYFVEVVSKTDENTPAEQLGPIVGEVVDRFNEAYTLSSTIEPFIYSFVSTDSRDKAATRALSEYEQISLPMQNLERAVEGLAGNGRAHAGRHPWSTAPLPKHMPSCSRKPPTRANS